MTPSRRGFFATLAALVATPSMALKAVADFLPSGMPGLVWHGEEVVYFDRALDPTEKSQMMTYLANKYGVSP